MAKQATDTHHLCFPRKRWNKGYARTLRYHWYMRVEIPMRTLHHDIHDAMPNGVPLPSPKELKVAIDKLNELARCGVISEKDGIEKRLAIIIPMFSHTDSGGARHAFSQQFDIASKFYHPKRSRRSRRK